VRSKKVELRIRYRLSTRVLPCWWSGRDNEPSRGLLDGDIPIRKQKQCGADFGNPEGVKEVTNREVSFIRDGILSEENGGGDQKTAMDLLYQTGGIALRKKAELSKVARKQRYRRYTKQLLFIWIIKNPRVRKSRHR